MNHTKLTGQVETVPLKVANINYTNNTIKSSK